MQPWRLKCLQQDTLFCFLEPIKIHLFTFSTRWVNFGIFHQKEPGGVLLSLDRQAHNFGGLGGGRLTFVKATYNYSKSSWHAERSNLSMSVRYTDKQGENVQQRFWKETGGRGGGGGVDKGLCIRRPNWDGRSSAARAAASAGRQRRPMMESISLLSGRMICRRHAAIGGCYRRALRKQEI